MPQDPILSPADAIQKMEGELAAMRAETDRNQLPELTPDQAFEHGYSAAISDFRRYTLTKENE